MSEKYASRGEQSRSEQAIGEQAIDRLLDEARLGESYGIRDELLELRALANVRLEPSVEVRALMTTPSAALPVPLASVPATAATEPIATAAPVDELAARRRKRRAGIAALAVAASLAAGATAAAASDGGIPGTIEHLGAVVGSVVSKLGPGSGGNAPDGNAPQRQGTLSTPNLPNREATAPAQPSPGSTSPEAPGSPRSTPHSSPGASGNGKQEDPRKGLQDIAKGNPGTVPIPTEIPSPALTLPSSVPSDLLPGNPTKP
ncbi:hypothetical protein AB6813_17905 [bacterium RCC_150]